MSEDSYTIGDWMPIPIPPEWDMDEDAAPARVAQIVTTEQVDEPGGVILTVITYDTGTKVWHRSFPGGGAQCGIVQPQIENRPGSSRA